MLVSYLLTCSFMSRAVSAGDYRDILITYLGTGPATAMLLDAHGRTAAEIDAKIYDIYQGNNFHLFWIKDGKPGTRAEAIRDVLRDAGSQGLVPADYFTEEIDHYWNGSGPGALVRLDVFLTMGMMRYVADQHEGREAPSRINPELFAGARSVKVNWPALWKSAFEALDMKAFMQAQAPPFLQYQALVNALANYREIEQGGGWPAVPEGKTLKSGMTDERIPIIRKRLLTEGYLTSDNADRMDIPVFDTDLENAVKKFQSRHNLSPDGIIGKQTLAAMNIPVEQKIQQIVINMERYRWLDRSIIGERLVAVNIAGFEALAGRPGHFTVKTPVIVGKKYHMTPVFNDTIKYVVFNPYWNVPPSIARNEILPKLRKDPHYTAGKNMRIFRGWGPDAPEVDPASIDWSKVSKREMNRYHVRQDPGPDNALGCLKLVFPNKYSVYLHDTPAHSLFRHEQRAFSHGCIRMDRPKVMAAWVLGGREKGWSVERINEIVASRKRQVVVLKKPVPIYILYRTTYVDTDGGNLYFYDDIYGRDKLLIKALPGKPDAG